jgi:hypothetical protein
LQLNLRRLRETVSMAQRWLQRLRELEQRVERVWLWLLGRVLQVLSM